MTTTPTVPGTSPTSTDRIHSLDGLRGVAALLVVIYHCLLVTPTLWDQIAGHPVRGTAQWLLAYTPLRIFWAGDDVVWIFFILSGFVLVRPYLDRRNLATGRYYVRRAIRLYVPFLGSFALAVVLKSLRPAPRGRFSGWIFVHELPTATGDAVKTLFLFAGDHTTYNNVWWSLRWEVWFSALLPFVIPLARRFRAHPIPIAALCLVVIGASNAGVTVLHVLKFGHDNPALYLPMFGLGVALAMGEDRVRVALGSRSTATIIVSTVVCSSLMTSTVAVLALLRHAHLSITAAWAIAGPIGLFGATGLVALALCGPGLRDALASSPMTWLGERSYTLYLTHEPILVFATLALGVQTLTWWWIPFGIACSLATTVVLFPIIERPALWTVARLGSARRNEPSPGVSGFTPHSGN
ncbi:MAG: acyltransferase [Actinobacteria bacterium]|nr:acyltransferase [Actinomycetota bacterium]